MDLAYWATFFLAGAQGMQRDQATDELYEPIRYQVEAHVLTESESFSHIFGGLLPSTPQFERIEERIRRAMHVNPAFAEAVWQILRRHSFSLIQDDLRDGVKLNEISDIPAEQLGDMTNTSQGAPQWAIALAIVILVLILLCCLGSLV